jgi:hypothetical protein
MQDERAACDEARTARDRNVICSNALLATLIEHHGRSTDKTPPPDHDEPPVIKIVPRPVVKLPDPISFNPAGINKIEIIKRLICAYFGVSRGSIESASRRHTAVRPRQLAMYLARKHTNRSFPEIGHRFGGRDHTTVLHAFNKISLLREQDRKVAADLEILEAELFA